MTKMSKINGLTEVSQNSKYDKNMKEIGKNSGTKTIRSIINSY